MKDIVSQYFDNSYPNMLAFFAKEQQLSDQELNDIMRIIKAKKDDTL
ncbi:MAG: BlaI/MecI/CopY family transcriptional regulator [Bacteroidia bacterium]